MYFIYNINLFSIFILLIILIYSIYKNRLFFSNLLNETSKSTKIIIIVTSILISIKILMSQFNFSTYTDEFLYIQIGRNIFQNFFTHSLQTRNFIHSIFNGIFMFIFGFSIVGVKVYNIFLGITLFVTNYLIAKKILIKNNIALLTSILFSTFPLLNIWLSRNESNLGYIALSLISIFLMIEFISNRINLNKFNILLCSIIALTSIYRQEGIIFILFYYLILILKYFYFKNNGINFKLLLMQSLGIFLIALPNLVYNLKFVFGTDWINTESSGMITSGSISIINFISNLKKYFPLLLKNNILLVLFLFMIISIIIIIIKIIKSDYIEKKLNTNYNYFLLLFWLISSFIIYFSSWFQTLASKDRFFLTFYPTIVILGIYGLKELIHFFVVILLKKQTKFANLIVNLIIVVLILINITANIRLDGTSEVCGPNLFKCQYYDFVNNLNNNYNLTHGIILTHNGNIETNIFQDYDTCKIDVMYDNDTLLNCINKHNQNIDEVNFFYFYGANCHYDSNLCNLELSSFNYDKNVSKLSLLHLDKNKILEKINN